MIKLKIFLRRRFPILQLTVFLLKRISLTFLKLFIKVKPHQIFFDSYNGKFVNCNPKYIYKGLLSRNIVGINDCIWCINDEKQAEYFEIEKFVKYETFRYFISVLSSKIIITNYAIPSYIPISKKQIVIHTWHGSEAYKKSGVDNPDDNYFLFTFLSKQREKQLTYFISSSELFSKAVRSGQLISENKLLKIGMPRNDILINKNLNASDIRKKLNINDSSFVILYAPTYRTVNHENVTYDIKLDIKKMINSFSQKFNQDIIVLFRAHYYFKSELELDNVLDVTSYPDMQELLYISDSLITDYSSSMWDFSLTEKPCFLFTPDLDDYYSKRGTYTEPEMWQGIICKSNDELEKNILEFNQNEYCEKLQNCKKYFNSYENGSATESICKIIKNELEVCN